MDFTTPILNAVLELWYLAPLFLLAGLIKTSSFKGFIGEAMVNFGLRHLLDSDEYHLIKNVTLPTEDGSTQIDHILVSRFGVFVIETKNMKGWIFGSAKQAQWTQQIYKHKTKFQNPLRQNYKHTKTLEAALNLDPQTIHSVIVFIGDSQFKTPIPENVTYARGCIDFIQSKQEVVFTKAEVAGIINQIQNGRLKPCRQTHKQHVQHVEKIIEQKNYQPECPKCSSPMKLRSVRKGEQAGKEFWGCSRFPKCRGIVDKSA